MSKGGITLAIYIAIGITGAFGQEPCCSSVAVKTTYPPIVRYDDPQPPMQPPPPDLSQVPEKVVMKWGAGGRVPDHRLTFHGYKLAGTKVELRGPCYSACTLILGYLERANLCIAPGAFMAFHAVRGEKYKAYMPVETRAMVESFPPEVRRWIERNGGWEKLPIDGFWTMYDRELWAMGYPKCN